MKMISAAALVLGLCSLASAGDEKADPIGTWKCEYVVGEAKRESTLVIKKDGDKLAGTMSYYDTQEATLKDVTFKGGELTFSADRVLKEATLTLQYKLKVEGDKFKGKIVVESEGMKLEFDIEAKREKKDK